MHIIFCANEKKIEKRIELNIESERYQRIEIFPFGGHIRRNSSENLSRHRLRDVYNTACLQSERCHFASSVNLLTALHCHEVERWKPKACSVHWRDRTVEEISMPGFTISNWQGARNRCQWCLSTWPNSFGSDSKCSLISLYWSDGFRFLTLLPYRCHTNKTYVKFAVRSFIIKRTMEFRSDKKQPSELATFSDKFPKIFRQLVMSFFILLFQYLFSWLSAVFRPPSEVLILVLQGPLSLTP